MNFIREQKYIKNQLKFLLNIQHPKLKMDQKTLTTNQLFWEKSQSFLLCLLHCQTHISNNRGVVFPTKQLFATPAECPTMRLNADISYLGIVSDPTGLRFSPIRLLSPGLRCHSQVQVITYASDQLGSHKLLLGFN